VTCAANDCEAETHHPEVPFCTIHWRMLPKPHCKKMWEQRVERGPGWDRLLHLGIAICLVREGWNGPDDEHVDVQGFDWGSGIQDGYRLHQQAVTICERFPARSS
jgi:hypothetical protein